MWGEHGKCVLKPKSHGSGIMVSDFIDEHNGYLRLTSEEFAQAVDKVAGLKQETHAEYGKDTGLFLGQLEDAIKTAKVKYPREKGYRVCLITAVAIEHLLKMRWMHQR